MPHDIDRVFRLAQASLWAIDPDKGEEIAAFLELAATGAAPGWPEDTRQAMAAEPIKGRAGPVHVIRLHGAIVPRGNMLGRMSGAVSAEQFIKTFQAAAADRSAEAIVLDIDSPGGSVDMIPEAAAAVRAARRDGRPIVAVANTLAASAAYWIAAQADELVVTPSGRVGSIGVYRMHQDVTGALSRQGVKATLISAGARKTEGHPAAPLSDVALRAMQEDVSGVYEQFVRDVAKGRGVEAAVVRADPEEAATHFGGGRAYGARDAVRLGMADRVETLDAALRRVARGAAAPSRERARRRLAMI